jgi:hypothetical protein
LTCRLCDHFVSQPVSLGCGHFFCQTCIEHHARTSWNCPGTYCCYEYRNRKERDYCMCGP